MSAITGSLSDDRALEELLGERPMLCRAARWGFDATTQLVTMASGREVVTQVRVAGLEGDHASLIRTAAGVLRSAGIEVPRLIGATASAARELLVFELVRGQPGPELLAHPVRGPMLARSMGALVHSMAAVTTSSLPTDETWATHETLVRAVDGLLVRLGPDAPPVAAGMALAEVVASALAEIGRSPWRVVVSHGDLVPANVLVADGGSLTLLDLADVAARHRALDAAWWMLIVRHHHADLAPTLVAAFRTRAWAAGLEPGDQLLASVALVRALQLAAARDPGDQRRHLLDLAASAISWSGSVSRSG